MVYVAVRVFSPAARLSVRDVSLDFKPPVALNTVVPFKVMVSLSADSVAVRQPIYAVVAAGTVTFHVDVAVEELTPLLSAIHLSPLPANLYEPFAVFRQSKISGAVGIFPIFVAIASNAAFCSDGIGDRCFTITDRFF